MQGKILDYNNEFKSGLIRGEDGNKYRFSIDDCKSAVTPIVGANVDFESSGDKAVEVYVLAQNTDEANTIKSESTPTINPETQKNVIQTVKKIVIWGVVIIIGIILISFLVEFTQAKNEDTKIRELRNGCANNDAKACYELGISDYYVSSLNSEETVGLDEKNEVLAKGCRLGNKDACREGEYYKEGCDLQDGESCYRLSQKIVDTQGLLGGSACDINPESETCRMFKEYDSNDAVKYRNLSCEYGYSQGCI